MVGKPKRFNSYDSIVDSSRKMVEGFGRQRQASSIGNTFKAPALQPRISTSGGGTSAGDDHDPVIVNEYDHGTLTSAENIDWSLANFHRCILGGNITFTMTNLPDPGKYETVVLEVKQDNTGSRTVTFADSFLNSHSPTINLVANKVTTLAFYTYDDGTDRILGFNTVQSIPLMIALSDETSTINKTFTTEPMVTFRMPSAMTLTDVRTSLTSSSSSGLVTVDVHEVGSTILSTLCSIDQGAKTSVGAAAPVVISDSTLADNAEITVFLTAKGSQASGLKLYLIGYQA